jgi:hypothetical protein
MAMFSSFLADDVFIYIESINCIAEAGEIRNKYRPVPVLGVKMLAHAQRP